MGGAPDRSAASDAAPKPLGLALSGGGFRAAFFHVGVLARLAETGVLPKVEVLSTVSGGSIVGALYYLRLRDLLRSRPDEEIGPKDYVRLVAEVERLLRAGVQRNIRGRVFANLGKNLWMLRRSYSRSDRIGDLYDRYLYKPAWGEGRRPRGFRRERQIELRELLIVPPGREVFDPDVDNAGRQNKVPILAVNATSLNSGHDWRFEAIRMGEPLAVDSKARARIDAVDKNMRLLQCYFEGEGLEVPAGQPLVTDAQQDFPMALAVAASAAVPGVFHPLAISGLYPRIRVQLVDGGVQDNQGLQALRDEGCEWTIVSDASGQMGDEDKPWPLLPAVVSRSMSVAEDRVRDGQLTSVPEETTTLVHLRMGLRPAEIAPLGSDGGGGEGTSRTPQGIDRRAQDLLSRVRTDLDYFSETEALALEADGYLLCASADAPLRQAHGDPIPQQVEWRFDPMRARIRDPEAELLAELAAAKSKFFRSFRLRPAAAAISLLALVLVATAAALALRGAIASLFELSWVLGVVAIAVVVWLAVWIWANLKPRLPWLYHR